MKNLLYSLCILLLLPAVAGAQEAQKINKKNLVVKEWKTDVKTNKKILDHVTTYNTDGKKVEEIEYGEKGQKWRKRYEYDESGKMSREMVYDEKNALVNYKKYEYNEFGKKKAQYTYDAKGKMTSIKNFEYISQDV